jgi:DNA-binding NtrC family response regulator
VPLFLRALRAAGAEPSNVEPRLLEALLLYAWPRNARQLVMLARALVVLYPQQQLLHQYLVRQLDECPVKVESKPAIQRRASTKDEHQLAAITEALEANSGNMAQAVLDLGISRTRAYRVLGRHGVDITSLRGTKPEGGEHD